MRRRQAGWVFAAALLIAACTRMGARSADQAGDGGPGSGDPEAAWMDTAEVRVTEDLCVGSETVELVDPASGQHAVVDRESFPPDAACHRS
jgi:hypothetical protein